MTQRVTITYLPGGFSVKLLLSAIILAILATPAFSDQQSLFIKANTQTVQFVNQMKPGQTATFFVHTPISVEAFGKTLVLPLHKKMGAIAKACEEMTANFQTLLDDLPGTHEIMNTLPNGCAQIMTLDKVGVLAVSESDAVTVITVNTIVAQPTE